MTIMEDEDRPRPHPSAQSRGELGRIAGLGIARIGGPGEDAQSKRRCNLMDEWITQPNRRSEPERTNATDLRDHGNRPVEVGQQADPAPQVEGPPMLIAVNRHGVPRGNHPPDQPRMSADILADHAKRRLGASFGQLVKDPRSDLGMWAIIKSQGDCIRPWHPPNHRSVPSRTGMPGGESVDSEQGRDAADQTGWPYHSSHHRAEYRSPIDCPGNRHHIQRTPPSRA